MRTAHPARSRQKARNTAAARSRRRVKQTRKHPTWLTPKIRRAMREEAGALNLTEPELMRLILSLAAAFRNGLLQQKSVDARSLLAVSESPLFSTVIQYIAQYAMKMAEPGTEELPSVDLPSTTPASPPTGMDAPTPGPPQMPTRPTVPTRPPGYEEWFLM